MSEQIEPALSAEEWRTGDLPQYPSLLGDITYVDEPASIAAIIAVANRQLPDSDPRKITREMIEEIRAAADWIDAAYDASSATEARKPWIARLKGHADALESYLPPET